MKSILFTLLLMMSVQAKEVFVGAYEFPPFIESKNYDRDFSGITIDLVDALNKIQSKYQFKVFLTSSKRRFKDFKEGRFDMLIFEDKKWGWQNYAISASSPFLKGGEVYITYNAPGKNQSFFDNIKDKSIEAYLGYHYGFAKFNADQKYLETNFNIRLTTSHHSNILKVAHGRSDIAIVTESYLMNFLRENPKLSKKILISEKKDQHYNHTILVRDGSSPSIEEVNQYISKLKDSGELKKILTAYGISNL